MGAEVEHHPLVGRKELTAEDCGGVERPPDDSASLGSPKICAPARLNVFTKLKARGSVRRINMASVFLSGWAIPENNTGEIIHDRGELE